MHAETLTRTIFTQQKLFRTEAFTDRFFKMHNNFYRQMVFLPGMFSAQKSYAQKVLRATFFTYRRFHTGASIPEMPLHGRRIAHSTHLHATNFYTERFCFPFLITYLSCSPSQVYVYTNTRTHTKTYGMYAICMLHIPMCVSYDKSPPQYLNIQYIYIILMHANAVHR